MSAADTELRDWALSGAMALTGHPNGSPLAAHGRPATAVRRCLDILAEHHPDADLPGVEILGERAAIMGLSRRGPWSCGGAFRALETTDGWIGLSLPRPTDHELVPALIGTTFSDDPWKAVAGWARGITADVAVERISLLGLAGGAVPEPQGDRPGVVVTAGGPRRSLSMQLRVLDLTSLWAGPLAAHLLGLCGAEVTKVESRSRLDGTRGGPAWFFDLLHAGHRMVALDLPQPEAVATLRRLIAEADLVLESSRARVLEQWGISAAETVAAGTSWLSITAYGRDQNRIGFGDDVAATAGLCAVDDGIPLPAGDALADPLTGVRAAAAAVEVLHRPTAALLDVSMHHVAAEVRGEVPPHTVRPNGRGWVVEYDGGETPIAPPRARRPSRAAGSPGADNGVLR